MIMLKPFVATHFILILTASVAVEVGWIAITVPKRALELWQVPLYCASDLDLRYVVPNYTVKWYKDGKPFYTYTTNKENPIDTFDVDGVVVNKLFSEKKEVLLEDISYKSAGMYRCEVTTEDPNSHTKYKEQAMNVQLYPGYGEQYTCMPEVFNKRQSLKIVCYFLVNGTNTARNPWNFNWYKDNQLIYGYTPEGVQTPHVAGVFLDSQLTYKNNIVLHHVSTKTNGKYTCEISLKSPDLLEEPQIYSYSVNIDDF